MKTKKYFALGIAISGTIGLLIVFLNTYFNPNPELSTSAFAQSVGLLKYFTMQSNILVVTYFWILFSLGLDKNESFNRLLGGVVVSITITFIVFAIMLQGTYQPVGWFKVSNLFNHYITPILAISFLLTFRNEYNFTLKDTRIWIIFPALYLVFMLIYGSITSDYLYPFFQIDEIGILMFLIAVVGLVLFFFILSILFMKIVSQKNV